MLAVLLLLSLPCSSDAYEIKRVAQGWLIIFDWTAPGDDGTVGTAAEYDLRAAYYPLTEINFASATRYPIKAPAVGLTPERDSIIVPDTTTVLHIAIKTADEERNWSPISNVLFLTLNIAPPTWVGWSHP